MKNLIFSLAKSDKELVKATSLVKSEYVKQGYLTPKNNINIPPFSATFIAKNNATMVGTVSVVADSEEGLPMDTMYQKELDHLRAQHKKIAEVCRLASDSTVLSDGGKMKGKYNSLYCVSSLFKIVFHYCIFKDYDTIVIAINPKHSLFYKSLFFEDIGGLKSHGYLHNAPALAKALDIKKLKSKKRKNYMLNKLFWDNPPNYKMFK